MTDPAQPVEATPETDNFLEGENPDMMSWPEFARSLERQLSLAQTENAGHIRIEDELKSDLAQAQARCAELERAVLGECEECGHTIISPLHHLSSVEKDAARYRWLRENAETITGAGINWHWQDEHRPHPPMQDLDAAIDAAISSAAKPPSR